MAYSSLLRIFNYKFIEISGLSQGQAYLFQVFDSAKKNAQWPKI